MERLTGKMTLEQCVGRSFSCSCGRVHTAALEGAFVGAGVLGKLPGWLNNHGYRSVYLIADENTARAAGEQTAQLLRQAGLQTTFHIIRHTGFDEATLGELLIGKPDDCDVVVAAGSGSINDMSRYLSTKLKLPYCIVGSAPSMDGFASNGSSLVVNNLKTSFSVHVPQLVVGDTDILCKAPGDMIAAGLCDLIGKFTCLCDWKLATLITGEYYCQTIVDIVENCARTVLENAGRVKERSPEVMRSIMEGLVITGVAMSMVGNSRPASGGEHHMSHFWETMFEQQGRKPAFHGLQVGVGTILMLKLAKKLRERENIDFDRARRAAQAYDPQQWAQTMKVVYGPAAEGVIAVEEQTQKNETQGRLARIDQMEAHWPEIQALLRDLPDAATVKALMQELDAPSIPEEIGVDKAMLRNTILYCKEIRARYTLLQVLFDLDLLEELADEVVVLEN
jgi:glycerol-1-phosphate dehydrogenase [NAD(P)+]